MSQVAVKAALSGIEGAVNIKKTVNINLTPNVTGGDAVKAAAASAAGGAPSHASGTPFVSRSGLAYLHRGEAVTPSSYVNRMASNVGGGGGHQIGSVNFHINGAQSPRNCERGASHFKSFGSASVV